jgi:hypothetical protein
MAALSSPSPTKQGFASIAPVLVLFEENVYCGDSSSTFFTVLWINRFCAVLVAVMCLYVQRVRASPELVLDCWKSPHLLVPRVSPRMLRRPLQPVQPLLQPHHLMIPPPLSSARLMQTFCLKSVEVPMSASVCCTCNAASDAACSLRSFYCG